MARRQFCKKGFVSVGRSGSIRSRAVFATSFGKAKSANPVSAMLNREEPQSKADRNFREHKHTGIGKYEAACVMFLTVEVG
jgi:hypothetical protein